MATNSKLESMPTELKIALLEQLPDVDTLSALIHASPIYHAVYLANREDVLTKATLRELSTRKQPLNIDELLTPAAVCHLVTKSGRLERDPELAIEACHAQANSTSKLKLGVEHCIALRSLLFYYSWRVVKKLVSEPEPRFVIYSNCATSYGEWTAPLRSLVVHILLLVDRHSSPGIARVGYGTQDVDWAQLSHIMLHGA